jgi:two-component system LytT family response regulator
MTTRTVIVDDEPPAREGIRLRLDSEADIEVVGEFGSAGEAMAALDEVRPDLLFLDVQMPGMSGIEMLRRIGADRVPAVILVTAYEEHALDAFDVSVVDYILKPIDTDRFRRALDRARVRLQQVQAVRLSGQIRTLIEHTEPTGNHPLQTEPTSAQKSAEYISRFLVSDGGGERVVSVDDVDWIEAAGDYVRLHQGSEYHLVRESMTHLEQVLDPRRFGRIHRSAIVRFDRIEEIVPIHHGDAEVRLKDGTVLRLSRSYREQFRQSISTPSPPVESE